MELKGSQLCSQQHAIGSYLLPVKISNLQTTHRGCFKSSWTGSSAPLLCLPLHNSITVESSWTGGSALLLCRRRQNRVTAMHCRQPMNFSNGPCIN